MSERVIYTHVRPKALRGIFRLFPHAKAWLNPWTGRAFVVIDRKGRRQ